MRRITRNQRIKDIEPEVERGPVEFKPHPMGGYEIFTQHLPRGDADHDTGKHIPRGDADHDPMFPRPTGVGAAWIGGLDPLPASPTPATPEPPLELLPEPPEQHNDHVMTYWTWRLDRLLEGMRNG